MAEAIALHVVRAGIRAGVNALAPMGKLGEDVERLRSERDLIWKAIRDADENHVIDQRQMMRWVKDCMDVMYQINDVVDDFHFERPKYSGDATELPKRLRFIDEMKIRIEEINERIQSIRRIGQETLGENIEESNTQPRDFSRPNAPAPSVYDRHDSGSERYYNLSFEMKLCFLYFGAFPEDFEIETRALLRIWIAEQLIPPVDGRTLEETAESFLKYFVERDMVIVNSIKYCRINDTLKSLAIQKSKEINFLVVCSKPDDWDRCKMAPRVAVHHSDGNVPMDNYASPNIVRSLLFFSKSSKIDCSIYRKLRVLANMRGEVELQRRTESPYMRGSPHLRYLQLNTVFKEKDFGKWVSGMLNLETLDLRLSMHDDLSNWIWNIDTLRHVLLSEYYGETEGPPTTFRDMFYCSQLRPKSQSANLESHRRSFNLQTITGVSWNNSWEKLGPPNMLEVRELGISIDRIPEGVDATIASLLDKLKHLEYLKIQGAVNSQIIPMDKFPFYENLKSLDLINDDYNSDYTLVLDDVMLPPNLTELELGFEFGSDPMPVLAKLRRLNTLRIRGARDFRNNPLTSIRCSAGWFKELEELVLESLRLKEWEIQKDAMPKLKRLNIRLCPLLIIPPELIHLDSLEYMTCIVIKTSLYFANRDAVRNIFEQRPHLQGGLREVFGDFIPFDSF
ncbi:NBS-LRR disease-resistance protein scn3r1 [Rhynchospora pubera]|uniref:NBS-LRR disease-resistance protein scn3r1 n=1 Tax=Rhynchospora pubera TaxID=906938 RepID=A0AAV8EM83_9POAL|nr:NBS-LRR disease-resistance protein scn3r1 [Rhynchospora pubera]